MSHFDPAVSILAGMDETTLRAQLATLQQAYLDLASGAKGESFSYTQGNGARSVTYTKANLGDLIRAIRLLQAQLGDIEAPRRAIGVNF